MFRFFLVWLTVSAGTTAWASEGLSSGEMYRTAHTPDQGEFIWHPLYYPSQVGILDPLSVSFGTLSMIPGVAPKFGELDLSVFNGPNIGLEYAPVESDSLAISIGPHFQMNWGGVWNMFGANARLTKSVGKSRVNVGLGFHRLSLNLDGLAGDAGVDGDIPSLGVNTLPVDFSFDLVAGKNTTFRFGVVYAPMFGAFVDEIKELAPDASMFILVPDVGWYQAVGKVFRLSVGAKLLKPPSGIFPDDLFPSYVPYPDVQLWFKF